jgi:hypothetical protein
VQTTTSVKPAAAAASVAKFEALQHGLHEFFAVSYTCWRGREPTKLTTCYIESNDRTWLERIRKLRAFPTQPAFRRKVQTTPKYSHFPRLNEPNLLTSNR